MSSRVTRSSAKPPADSTTAPTSENSHPSPSQPPKPPTHQKKRSAAARETSPEVSDPPVDSDTRRRSKRPRRAATDLQPPHSTATRAPSVHSKVVMSSPSAPSDPSNDNNNPATSTAATSGRKSRRGKGSSTEPKPDRSTSRRTASTSSKKKDNGQSRSQQDKANTPSPGQTSNPDEDIAMGDNSDEDRPPHNHDEDDEDMDEDAIQNFLSARAGGSSGLAHTLRALTGAISSNTTRLRQLIENLKQKDDPSVQLIALQELSDTLLISTEDNIGGHFSPESLVTELVSLMSGDEFGEGNPEMMLLACRCMANLMEALPAAAATCVYNGAVPALIAKLREIQYMDVAEQALTTLEKISTEYPTAIVKNGGLGPCLMYLDFFATSTQRTAVTIAANCCRNVPEECFEDVKEVMPILLNVTNGNDQRVVEQGCLCVSRIAESFKFLDSKLEELMSPELLRVILRLLVPGSTNLIGSHIHTQFLRVLSFTARASSKLTVELFKMNVVDTLYQILTGVSPPSGVDNVAQKIDSVVIMQALIHRPREQVFETLNVVCELLPGLSKDDTGMVDDLFEATGFAGIAMHARVKKSPLQKRLDMLADCRDELRRFAVILFPTLTDAYSSTVNLNVREKVLTAQLKMLSNLDSDILEEALRPVPYASFLASILSQQDHPLLVTAALQAVELLLKRLESIYRYQFYREGVIAEVRKLSERPKESAPTTQVAVPANDPSDAASVAVPESSVVVESSIEEPHSDSDDGDNDDLDDNDDIDEDPDDDGDSSDSSDDQTPRMPAVPSSSMQDVLTSHAQTFIERFENEHGRELREQAINTLDTLRELVSNISDCFELGKTEEGGKLFKQLARYFEGDALQSVTSYELLTSKVVRILLEILESTEGQPSNNARAAFIEAFMSPSTSNKVKTASSDSPATPFSVLVHKLQDLLSRAEHFEVVTVHQNAFDSSRSSAANMLAKQIRIRLDAGDDSGIPRHFRNIMVSIHAIATFKALDDYLRPRISLAEQPRSGRRRDGANASPHSSALAGLDSPDSTFSRRTDTFSEADTPTNAPSRSNKKPPRPKSGSGSSSNATPQATTSNEETTPTRRFTRRTKAAPPTSTPPPMTAPSGEPGSSQSALQCADETPLSDDEAVEERRALDAIVGELADELEDERETSDPSAVNLEVANTGKVTARQEDGTRIATPTGSQSGLTRPPPAMWPRTSEAARSLLSSSLMNRPSSYAAAVQAIPTNWHLEFSVDGQPITNDTTIYRVVHSNQKQTEDSSNRNLWSSIHTINFKRVQGPPPAEPSTLSPPSEPAPLEESGLPKSLDRNPITADILRLLKILHEVNANLEELVGSTRPTIINNEEPLTQFVNTKLTAKLNRQLEEPLIVASSCLPGWSEDLSRLYPFLFPFETRYLFLQSTSFGYSRSMSRWQSTQSNNEAGRERHRDERPFLGRLQRQKVRISRTKILESAIKVLELYGASPSVLEVEYFEEVGTGLGPTLEFYSNVSKEFSKKKLRLWRESDSPSSDEYAFGKRGLFPAPMSESMANTENGKRVLQLFKMLGKFVARSMLDSRIIDISFNPLFFRNDLQSSSSLGAVKIVDSDLANSLLTLKQFATAKKKIDKQQLTASQKAQKIAQIRVGSATVEDLGLDFTLPGYPSIDLIPNGSDTPVTIANIDMYVDKVIDFTLNEGVRRQMEAFRAGFSQVFPYNALKAFTPDELVMLFGRVEEDWSIETLMDSIKADHGYNLDSKSVRNLLQIMSEFEAPMRREFLQFITGSPKLPIGGFKNLTPMFTVVCKPSEQPYTSDDYLPSVMTCVNYLKLPDYSSVEIMRERLNVAVQEGQGAFHLS